MAVFVLVHGMCCGAWCWDYLTPPLSALGHECVAVDLPCDDPQAGFAVYARRVTAALGKRDDVILVGHSLGGLTIPVVAADRQVRRLVYLCAGLPRPGVSWMDQESGDPTLAHEPAFVPVVHDDGTTSVPEQGAIDGFFHDCRPQVQRWAIAHLRRQGWLPFIEPTPLARLPDVPSSVILAREDPILPTAYTRQTAQQLGVVAIELDGGHSPLLARPEELAHELDNLASL